MTAAIERWLERRGVTVRDVAEIVLSLQRPYNGRLTISDCEESVRAVLAKREVQYTLLTGIALDELADRGLLPEPLQRIMEDDESLYGVDETLALGIVSVYGMIGLTSFGYLDKMKPGVIGRLNGAGDGNGGRREAGAGGGTGDHSESARMAADLPEAAGGTGDKSESAGRTVEFPDSAGGTGDKSESAGRTVEFPDSAGGTSDLQESAGGTIDVPAAFGQGEADRADGRMSGGEGERAGARCRVHVFLDDLVSALAAAASARIAHQNPDARDYGLPGEG